MEGEERMARIKEEGVARMKGGGSGTTGGLTRGVCTYSGILHAFICLLSLTVYLFTLVGVAVEVIPCCLSS